MSINFRAFQNKDEETKISELLSTIDSSEKWLFEGAKDSKEFGGFQERLYFSHEDTYGTYTACIFANKLHIQVGFNTDMPEELKTELLVLIEKSRKKVNAFTSIWYLPRNEKLDNFLFNDLPWKVKGHKTHELTALCEDFENITCILESNITIVPFEEKYIIDTCTMLDKSMSHTFDNPNKSVFLIKQNYFLKNWIEKSKTGECCIMLEDNTVIGAYILNGSEIDILAILVDKQGKGLGKQLLRHAIKHILLSCDDLPHLYCIDSNINALCFYLREGLKVTGHSGYAYFV